MQLEDDIAKELAGIIKGQVGTLRDMLVGLDTRMLAVEAVKSEPEYSAPADVIDEIAKAIALLAEAPPLTQGSNGNPVVVNFSPSQNQFKRAKTITTRRDEAGNLVARVIED